MLLGGVLVPLLALPGCVRRTITVTSQPAGALVYLNDEEVGRTPVTVPFQFYGSYDVRLEKAGYEPLWTIGEARAPWWETPGVDLLAEAVPGARSEVRWHYALVSAPDVSDDATAAEDRERLLRAAAQTRQALDP